MAIVVLFPGQNGLAERKNLLIPSDADINAAKTGWYGVYIQHYLSGRDLPRLGMSGGVLGPISTEAGWVWGLTSFCPLRFLSCAETGGAY